MPCGEAVAPRGGVREDDPADLDGVGTGSLLGDDRVGHQRAGRAGVHGLHGEGLVGGFGLQRELAVGGSDGDVEGAVALDQGLKASQHARPIRRQGQGLCRCASDPLGDKRVSQGPQHVAGGLPSRRNVADLYITHLQHELVTRRHRHAAQVQRALQASAWCGDSYTRQPGRGRGIGDGHAALVAQLHSHLVRPHSGGQVQEEVVARAHGVDLAIDDDRVARTGRDIPPEEHLALLLDASRRRRGRHAAGVEHRGECRHRCGIDGEGLVDRPRVEAKPTQRCIGSGRGEHVVRIRADRRDRGGLGTCVDAHHRIAEFNTPPRLPRAEQGRDAASAVGHWQASRSREADRRAAHDDGVRGGFGVLDPAEVDGARTQHLHGLALLDQRLQHLRHICPGSGGPDIACGGRGAQRRVGIDQRRQGIGDGLQRVASRSFDGEGLAADVEAVSVTFGHRQPGQAHPHPTQGRVVDGGTATLGQALQLLRLHSYRGRGRIDPSANVSIDQRDDAAACVGVQRRACLHLGGQRRGHGGGCRAARKLVPHHHLVGAAANGEHIARAHLGRQGPQLQRAPLRRVERLGDSRAVLVRDRDLRA